MNNQKSKLTLYPIVILSILITFLSIWYHEYTPIYLLTIFMILTGLIRYIKNKSNDRLD